MVWYTDLRNERLFTLAERDWTSRRLLDLRAQLASPPPNGVPRRTKDASLIIGTWNIRDVDNNQTARAAAKACITSPKSSPPSMSARCRKSTKTSSP